LFLVQHYPQGEILKILIPITEFLTGKMADGKREQSINDLRERKKACLIATSLADEGLNIPTLDAVLLAGGGASSTRVHQRIGRTLRIDRKSANPRDRSIIIYFEHHGAKYLDKHAKKARRIMKMEPLFHIIDSAGPTYIKQEIDQIMDNKDKPLSL
jgi:superfamily II DNA or RNA helicase